MVPTHLFCERGEKDGRARRREVEEPVVRQASPHHTQGLTRLLPRWHECDSPTGQKKMLAAQAIGNARSEARRFSIVIKSSKIIHHLS